VIEDLAGDPEFAAGYLQAVREDGDDQELMDAMRRVATAFGGVPELDEPAQRNAKISN
jgi:DNA-binding phage protein